MRLKDQIKISRKDKIVTIAVITRFTSIKEASKFEKEARGK